MNSMLEPAMHPSARARRILTTALGALLLPLAASAQSLTTINTGGTSVDGVLFDITATKTLTVTNFDISLKKGGSTVELYYVAGDWASNIATPNAWTLAGSAQVTGGQVFKPLPITLSVTIPAGQTYAFYITKVFATDGALNATVGTGTVYSNADMQLFEGAECNYSFGNPSVPRTFNGTVYYNLGSSPCTVSTYCTAQMSSLACTPSIGAAGVASATSANAFNISGTGVIAGKVGRFMYGKTGRQSLPFQGGTLCVQTPLRMLPLAKASGTTGCNGVITVDFNAWIRSGKDAALVPGLQVNGQWMTRDSQSIAGTNLTNAVEFTICP